MIRRDEQRTPGRDRPGTGFITVSQQPMIDAATSIASYAPMVAK